MPQARHVGPALSLCHRVQVRLPGRIGAITGQVERQLGHAIGQRAPSMQTRAGEHLQHRGVLRQDFGGKSPHPLVLGRRHQLLEQQRRQPPVVGMVGDGERDLRRAVRAADLVAGDTH
jgi:hypothetical protein